MSVVFSIRIPKNLKELMEKFEDINWSDEVRKYIAQRVREKLIEEHLNIARKARKKLSKTPISIDKLIREDRECVH